MRLKNKTTKKCPRCGNKCLINQSACEECGLLFSRLEFASNKEAKKKLLRFDSDYVIYTNQYPKDVKYWKVLLYSILFGLVGGHYYYVGKYVKGGLMSASFLYLIFCTIFNDYMVQLLENSYFYLPIGIAGFAWLYSFCMILLRKFKVPVTVALPQEKFGKNGEQKDKEDVKNQEDLKTNSVMQYDEKSIDTQTISESEQKSEIKAKENQKKQCNLHKKGKK